MVRLHPKQTKIALAGAQRFEIRTSESKRQQADLPLAVSPRGKFSSVFKAITALWLACLCVTCWSSTLTAQSVDTALNEYLQHGEFSLATERAAQLPTVDADLGRQRVAFAQMLGGAPQGAWQTASRIQSGPVRNETLGGLFQPGGATAGGEAAGGAAGGITEADFQPLIDLIQSTIAPDEWAETGQGDGTIEPWPAGVYVDAAGTLHRVQVENSGQLAGLREQLRRQQIAAESSVNAELRAISLRQLERSAELAAAQGKPLSPWVQNLGGLVAIKYVIAQPDRKDILLVGPAGPWRLDANGHAISVASGLPVLQLDDLVVCLRNARDWNGIFGCSITPRQQNLAQAKDFLATTKLTGNRFREELRSTLGQQDVEVFGIAPDSHLASVLVEADYRMKLVGMGIEPSIPEVPSYLDRVEILPDGGAPPLDVARWWFTLNYDQLQTDEQRLAFAFTGTGVKVQAETEFVNARGERIHTGKAVGPTKAFAEDFTRHFDKLARKYPIYSQLRGAFDLALVAAIIEREQLVERSGWEPTFFASETSSGELRYHAATATVAKQVDSVMNHRVIRARRGSKTSVHTLIGVSGGVHCDFGSWLESVEGTRSRSLDLPASLRELTGAAPADDRWWWD